jgi:integrase
MAVYLPKYRAADGTTKISKIYWIDFVFRGQSIRESTGTRSITLAKRIQDKRRRELEEGTSGIVQKALPMLFSTAAEEYLSAKSESIANSSLMIEKANLVHLKKSFGHNLLSDIDASHIALYQKRRLAAAASPRTINLEFGTLRAILRRKGFWARIQPHVKMLASEKEVGRALNQYEEAALLKACAESRSRILYPFVTLAIETGARFGVLRTLKWEFVDLERQSLRFGKDKTAAGTGRIIPLNARATAVLIEWANQFPNRRPGHFVFPQEKYGGNGTQDLFGFSTGNVYDTNPLMPIGEIKVAWEYAKRRAGALLDNRNSMDGTPSHLICRFHDLRHTAVSRMLNAGIPLAKIAKVVGWSTSTMVQMSARYGHFTLDDLRGAVESITRPSVSPGNCETSPSTHSRTKLNEAL